jgi:hypothetical protein
MRLSRWVIFTAGLGILTIAQAELGPGPRPADAEECRYIEVTINGRLVDPETEQPMVDAIVWFTPFDVEGPKRRSQTDAEGRFRVGGLSCAKYLITIETAGGETIRGVNNFELTGDRQQTMEMRFAISDRYQSDDSVNVQPERWAVVQSVDKPKWKRFWKQFAIFFGVAVAAGAAAL